MDRICLVILFFQFSLCSCIYIRQFLKDDVFVSGGLDRQLMVWAYPESGSPIKKQTLSCDFKINSLCHIPQSTNDNSKTMMAIAGTCRQQTNDYGITIMSIDLS